MKTIGFIDYYISEWHANNYIKWIEKISKETGEDFAVKYVWAELDISPVDKKSTQQWCKENRTEQCSSLEEICEKSDFLIILSPSNPEKHIEYAKIVLRYGKNTYIDKTFAENYIQAKEIYQLAEKYKANIFSASALRYADELKEFSEISEFSEITTTGGGSSPEEYIIHQIEQIVKLYDAVPVAVKAEKRESQHTYSIEFENKKKAYMFYAPALGFTICAKTTNGTKEKNISSPFFESLIADILRFFNSGVPSFDKRQTLNAIKIRDGIKYAMNNPSSWINI